MRGRRVGAEGERRHRIRYDEVAAIVTDCVLDMDLDMDRLLRWTECAADPARRQPPRTPDVQKTPKHPLFGCDGVRDEDGANGLR